MARERGSGAADTEKGTDDRSEKHLTRKTRMGDNVQGALARIKVTPARTLFREQPTGEGQCAWRESLSNLLERTCSEEGKKSLKLDRVVNSHLEKGASKDGEEGQKLRV